MKKHLSPIKEQASSQQDQKVLPDNYEIENVLANPLYIIDFGLSKFFIDYNTGIHIPQK
jgi:hypothetical protein|tara:strand:+ start:81 stop:257 length:177 start_codon:yes stop_codon:yes gene_type:complete